MSTVGTVSEIWRYPVKSIAGERVTAADLDTLGIPGDRRYALRNLDTGKIISAKLPKLGRELLALQAVLDETTGRIPVDHDGEVLGDVGREELDRALSERLGVPVRIEAATTADEVYESYWPENEGLALSDIQTDLPVAMLTEKGTFVDLAALHLVTTSALRHLDALAAASVIAVERFRPSLVIDTGSSEGFVENEWADTMASLGAARISITTASPRCVMTTLAQPGLPEDRAVLKTLAAENRHDYGGLGDFACLGVYAEVVEGGRVAVGDELTLD
jgi:uncharacterized protein YcbX